MFSLQGELQDDLYEAYYLIIEAPLGTSDLRLGECIFRQLTDRTCFVRHAPGMFRTPYHDRSMHRDRKVMWCILDTMYRFDLGR